MRRSIATLGALIVGTLAFAAGGASGEPRTVAASCSASELSAVYVNTTGAMGSRDAEYGFKNTGARQCTLRGYPTVQMLTSAGAKLSTSLSHAATGAMGITLKSVSLAHGAVAYFDLHYASQTGFGTLKCPSSAALRLTAPGEMAGSVLHVTGGEIRPYGGSIPHLHCGIIEVTPVTAKRFQ
jgi:hypothetical protein